VIESTAKSSKLLLVSGDSSIAEVFLSIAAANGWISEIAADAWDALDRVHGVGSFDLIVLDLLEQASDGLKILRSLRRFRPALGAVLIGYPGGLDRRQEALRLGVRDYLVRPFEDRQLELAMRRNLRATASLPPFEGICGYKSLRSLLQSVKEEAEKNAIALALEKTGWNRKAAARLLKTSYRSVLYKIEQYHMNSPRIPATPGRAQAAIAELGDALDAGKSAFEFQPADSARFDD
jgi:DNA-binding NtrC family response regulator